MTSYLATQIGRGVVLNTPTADGTNGQFVKTNGAGVLSFGDGAGIANLNGLSGGTQTFAVGTAGTDFAITSSGTAHTFDIPSASATNRGLVTIGAQVFGGTKTFTPAANTSAFAVSGFSLTGANAQSLADLAGTFNTSGTPTAWKLNITDTASNAASLLADWQVGGTSQVKISKTGRMVLGGLGTLATDAILILSQPIDFTTPALRIAQFNAPTTRFYDWLMTSNGGNIALQQQVTLSGTPGYAWFVRDNGAFAVGRWDNLDSGLVSTLSQMNVCTGAAIPGNGTQHGMIVFDSTAERMRFQMTTGTPIDGLNSVQVLHIELTGDLALCGRATAASKVRVYCSAGAALAEQLTIAVGTMTFANALNMAFNTSTGTKIGTGTTQKIGFWNATPVAQQTVTGSRGGNAALADLLTKLATAGLIVDGTS